ncbi:Aste57867_2557 [Aphanomyces stellatus]|uniref:Aste57867_2557 protein n=1 Tax=Aphanomyces stellatus TaxID=120398 RepID=A0A485K7W1_9STRA|nr:hypothetical protein As57867_002550 [Aphanomyces stellatus]VFT79753.1 Aste57867_2557 [Aphanomyces stellatus]
MLQSLASVHSPFARDAVAYSLQYTLELPNDGVIDHDECIGHMLAFPGAALFGPGIRQFACAYLAHNASIRAALVTSSQVQATDASPLAVTDSTATFRCQVGLMLGVPTMKLCLWLVPTNSSTNATSQYVVGFGGTTYEPPALAYLKLTCRVCLCGFILYLVRAAYYVHFATLDANLKASRGRLLGDVGDATVYALFDIHVGDPTYLVLSHPYVTVCFVLEMVLDITYQGLSSLRCTQMLDLWQFALGCFYGSRSVWFGYWTIRYGTIFVKLFHCEGSYATVDPGLLATAAVFYSGPLFYGMCSVQPIVQTLHQLFSTNGNATAIELFPVWVSIFATLGGLPLLYSYGAKYIRTSHLCHRPTVAPTTFDSRHYSHGSFNDLKMRLLYTVFDRPSLIPSAITLPFEGGSLYRLYDQHPGYQKLPLISHRSADCFVDCYLPGHEFVKKVRLSLLHCLDRQTHDPKWALPLCETCGPGGAVSCGPVSTISSATHSMTKTNTKLSETAKIHMGANGCCWVL